MNLANGPHEKCSVASERDADKKRLKRGTHKTVNDVAAPLRRRAQKGMLRLADLHHAESCRASSRPDQTLPAALPLRLSKDLWTLMVMFGRLDDG
jgi:hypothetical protein